MASWLVRSSPNPAIRVRALVADIVLCSWTRHFSPTAPLFTQEYKLVPANLMLGVTLHATETGISSDLMGHLACMQTSPTLPSVL